MRRAAVGRSSKKPRKNKLNPGQFDTVQKGQKKQEKDWTFDDILRSKLRRR